MNAFPVLKLLNLATGQSLPPEWDSKPERLRLAITALFCALVLVALWGVLAGISVPALALSNAWRLPLVVLLSALTAVPPGLLALKLGGSSVRGSSLVMAFALATFVGTLVMAALSPVVALYYFSSTWAGPVLALGSLACGVVSGLAVFWRRVCSERDRGPSKGGTFLPMAVLAGLQLAALFQMVALAGPMLPERTGMDRGVDGIFQRR